MKKQIKKKTKQNSATVTAGYILSIISVATCLFGTGFIVGIPGLVCSIVGRGKVTDPTLKQKGTKGMIMSIVGIAVGLITSIILAILAVVLIWKFIIW